MPPRAAYIHVPFCHRRCGYCNFTVVVGRDDLLVGRYLQAISQELNRLGTPREVDTLFLGGGTPTYLQPKALKRLLDTATRWFPPATGYEWSVEANPEDLEDGRLAVLADAGVNRISLGIQSFHGGKLQTLERRHGRQQALDAVRICRERFDCVAVDLIFAAPGESIEIWRQDLQTAIDSGCDHISTYGLTYEKGAAFWARREHGRLDPSDEEQERRMYELAIDTLTAAGFEHYEVSNFARPGRRCRHNLTYWMGGEYDAAGPGAARFVDGWREMNHRSTSTYLKRIEAGQSPVAERERLDPKAQAIERLIFQLRLLDGLDITAFEQTTGFTLAALVGRQIDEFIELGLLEQRADNLRLTRQGLLVSDSIWGYLLSQTPS